MNTRTPPLRGPRGRTTAGFSLAETMIAIGILGIGMAMSASIFPAALKEVQRSTNTQLGLIICENALTMARSAFRKADLPAPGVSLKLMDEATYKDRFGGAFGYPISSFWKDSSTQFAYKYWVFTRYKTDSLCQVVAVAYRKNSHTAAQFAQLQGSINTTGGTRGRRITGGGSFLRTGTAVINAATGEYAICVAADGISGLLDRDVEPMTAGAWVFYEKDPAGATSPLPLSPVIGVMGLEAGIRQ